jgi:hypothetical protein
VNSSPFPNPNPEYQAVAHASLGDGPYRRIIAPPGKGHAFLFPVCVLKNAGSSKYYRGTLEIWIGFSRAPLRLSLL